MPAYDSDPLTNIMVASALSDMDEVDACIASMNLDERQELMKACQTVENRIRDYEEKI